MITDYEKMADVLEQNGYPKETLYERAQRTLTEREKMVGKKDFQTICGELDVYKRQVHHDIVVVDFHFVCYRNVCTFMCSIKLIFHLLVR